MSLAREASVLMELKKSDLKDFFFLLYTSLSCWRIHRPYSRCPAGASTDHAVAVLLAHPSTIQSLTCWRRGPGDSDASRLRPSHNLLRPASQNSYLAGPFRYSCPRMDKPPAPWPPGPAPSPPRPGDGPPPAIAQPFSTLLHPSLPATSIIFFSTKIFLWPHPIHRIAPGDAENILPGSLLQGNRAR